MQIIGHRGASGLAPENTLAAFRLAADLGAQAIETDLWLTRDGRLVLLHDNKLQGTTSGRGLVTDKSWKELQCLDAGSRFPRRFWRKRHAPTRFAGERIPALEELLDLANQRDIGLYLEIKAPCVHGTEQALVATLRRADALARSAVISFDPAILNRVRQADPAVTLGYTFERHKRDSVAQALALGARIILPQAGCVTPKLIAEARHHGLQVVTWTVNDPTRMKKLIALGVDGIMSDFPDRLAAVVARTA